jgi:hydrogenase nickel incorporation protein HypA/HybF
MHEIGIMQSVLETVLGQAEQQHATRVHRVTLRVGVFTGVVPDALQFAFEVLTKGTPAEGAELCIVTAPARSTCRECGAEYEVKDLASLECPGCHGFSDNFRGGRELEISDIEIS